MKVLLPRAIKGNRGDLASRWFMLEALRSYQHLEPIVFSYLPEDIPTGIKRYPYGPLRNLLPTLKSWRDVWSAQKVCWAVGLDMQDDSSLVKLLYLWIVFTLYSLSGKEIWCCFQGAGPITTSVGRWLMKRILNRVKIFVARDPYSQHLVKTFATKTQVLLGHDAIFLPRQEGYSTGNLENRSLLAELFSTERPVIGFNLRQWFHFSSSWLPYQFAQKRYRARSLPQMQVLVNKSIEVISTLRSKYNARVVLISAYQPSIEPWEDDLTWLAKVKVAFGTDEEVILLKEKLSMPLYFELMSRLTLTIGMRLHTTLLALRHGVPSLNLNYTLKGRAIVEYLGLSDYVIDLGDFLHSSEPVLQWVEKILPSREEQSKRINALVEVAITQNQALLDELLLHIE